MIKRIHGILARKARLQGRTKLGNTRACLCRHKHAMHIAIFVEFNATCISTEAKQVAFVDDDQLRNVSGADFSEHHVYGFDLLLTLIARAVDDVQQ